MAKGKSTTMHKTSVIPKGRFFEIGLSNDIFFFGESKRVCFNISEKALRELNQQISELLEEIDTNGN